MKNTRKLICKTLFIMLIILFIVLNIKVQAYDFKVEYKYVAETCFNNAKATAEAKNISYSTALAAIKTKVLDSNDDYLENILGSKPDQGFRNSLAEFIQDEIDAQTTGEVTAPEGLTDERKREIQDSVKVWMQEYKNRYNYTTLLQDKMKTNEWDTDDENEYARSLYKNEYEKVVTNASVEDLYQSGLNKTQLEKAIKDCEDKIAQLEQLPNSYIDPDSGKTRNQLINEQRALKQKYEEDLGTTIAGGSSSNTGVLGQSSASGSHTVDEVLTEAENFINAGKNKGTKIDTDSLKTASNTLYNMLLAIGIVIAVIVGMYLGVKFMLSSAEDKAKVKESLVPYIAGCVIIFGAFIIWKLAILLLGGIA